MDAKVTPTLSDYERAFRAECAQSYPAIDEFETECGFAVQCERLEGAARLLACPVKINPPNWQHGRVIYALVRKYLSTHRVRRPMRFLDIGTAKGFSALCALWACVDDRQTQVAITSVDVIDPEARVFRNSAADPEGRLTLREILEPWPLERDNIAFLQSTGVTWLSVINRGKPLDFAFVDGKHNYQTVRDEIALLATCQPPGAVALFDDAQVPGVRRAVSESRDYQVSFLEAKPGRIYGIGTRL